MTNEESYDVYLYVYDMSNGFAATLSLDLIGKHINGVWHTGVVCYNKEYFFGQVGITSTAPGGFIGEPLEKIHLGKTHVPEQLFEEYIESLHQSEFSGSKYNLLAHNCNHFSDTVSNFLIGSGIPQHILDLPNEILNTPLGETLEGILNFLDNPFPIIPGSESQRNNFQSSSERCSVNVNNPSKKGGGENMSDEGQDSVQVDKNGATPQQIAEQIAEEDRKEKEEKRKNREPPVVYKDAVDVHIEFDKLVGLIDGKLNEDEQLSLEELHQYMFQDEGSWALGDSFLIFIGRLLTDASLGPETSVCCLNVLAAAALKDDIILMLHQDRKHHILMNYAQDIDRLPLPQQKALALFICNLFENPSSSEWMLYISEWMKDSLSLSNIRVLTKVAVNSLLSEDTELYERGTAIIHNIATKEVKTVVFDDVAVELTMAILQFLGGTPTEPHVFRCLKALAKFAQIASQDVPQLVQMIGPHPSKFKGQSERIDLLVDELSRRIR